MSQESCDALQAVLAEHYTTVGVTIVNELADLRALAAIAPDLAFLGMEYIPVHPALGWSDPARIWIAEYLEARGIACTGSSYLAHELGRDKTLAKQRVLEAGLSTAAFCVVPQGQALQAGIFPLQFPVFIKPTSRGGGLGIDSDSVAHTFEQLQAKVQTIATKHYSDSLVEEYLQGREFSVAILKQEDVLAYAVMPIELIAPPDQRGARILSAHVKSSNTEQAIAVAGPARQHVCQLALDVFQALGGRDYGRIDIRMDAHGTPHFLEVNFIPSLISGYGSFPKACMLNKHIDYETMILSITRLGMARSASECVTIPIQKGAYGKRQLSSQKRDQEKEEATAVAI